MKNKLRSLHKVLLSFLAIAILVVNTACSSAEVGAANADEPNTVDRKPAGQVTELYKPIAPKEGGMNQYSDTDPRRNKSGAEAKADRNIGKSTAQKGGVNPIEEAKRELDRKGPKERAAEASDSIGRTAQEKADQVAQGTQRGINKLQGNAKSLHNDAGSAADDLASKASNKADSLTNKVGNKVDELADKVSNKADELGRKVSGKAADGDDVKDAANRTANAVSNRANKV